jgi:hypothetical protein
VPPSVASVTRAQPSSPVACCAATQSRPLVAACHASVTASQEPRRPSRSASSSVSLSRCSRACGPTVVISGSRRAMSRRTVDSSISSASAWCSSTSHPIASASSRARRRASIFASRLRHRRRWSSWARRARSSPFRPSRSPARWRIVSVSMNADPPSSWTLSRTAASSSARAAATFAAHTGQAHTLPHVTRPSNPAVRPSGRLDITRTAPCSGSLSEPHRRTRAKLVIFCACVRRRHRARRAERETACPSPHAFAAAPSLLGPGKTVRPLPRAGAVIGHHQRSGPALTRRGCPAPSGRARFPSCLRPGARTRPRGPAPGRGQRRPARGGVPGAARACGNQVLRPGPGHHQGSSRPARERAS